MKKCFLLCETLLLVTLLVGCSTDPVYIADEIDPGELWSFTETTASPESSVLPETSDQTNAPPDGDMIVYYTPSGAVWHTSPDCSALSRAKNILNGTTEQAMEAGMSRACKRCGG